MSESNSGGGCSCLGIVVTILLFAALLGALPTPWGVLNIDLLPPGIYLTKTEKP